MSLKLGFAYDDSFELVILHPQLGVPFEGPDGPFTVELYSPNSERMRTFEDKQIDRAMIRNAKLNRQALPMSEARAVLDERIVMAHKSWKSVPVNGEQPECTPDNVREMVSDPDNAWYRDQISEAFKETRNFQKAASTRS